MCQKAPSAKRCIKTRFRGLLLRSSCRVRKHRAPNGALRHWFCTHDPAGRMYCQKAPSAKRCIKTQERRGSPQGSCGSVRKHRAPKGALRPRSSHSPQLSFFVRKHRAPKGALRQAYRQNPGGDLDRSQKAPSAKRCIKTCSASRWGEPPSRASESTERQKAH